MLRWLLVMLAAALFVSASEARLTPEAEVMALINNARAAGTRCNGGGGYKLPRLSFNATLARVAEGHAVNMGRGRFVSHYYQGIGPRTRVARAGYRYSRMSEIIFLGTSSSAARALSWWQHSRVHCQALMNRYYTQIGAGYYNGAFVVEMALPR